MATQDALKKAGIRANVERGEQVVTPDGVSRKVKGARHEKGGVNITVPPATMVYSDRLFGSNGESLADRRREREARFKKVAKKFEKRPSDTFARSAFTRTLEQFVQEEMEDTAIQELANLAEAYDVGETPNEPTLKNGGRVRPREYKLGGFVGELLSGLGDAGKAMVMANPAVQLINKFGGGDVIDFDYQTDFGQSAEGAMTGVNELALQLGLKALTGGAGGGVPSFANGTPSTGIGGGLPSLLKQLFGDLAAVQQNSFGQTPNYMDAPTLNPNQVDARLQQVNLLPTLGLPKSVSSKGDNLEPYPYMDETDTPSTDGGGGGGGNGSGMNLGDVGTLVGGVTPLITTILNRLGDKEEINPYQGVGSRALSSNQESTQRLQEIYDLMNTQAQLQQAGARRQIRGGAGSRQNLIAGELALNTAANDTASGNALRFMETLQRNLGERTNLLLQSDSQEAGGEERRQNREVANRDAFFTALAQNLQLIGATGQQLERNKRLKKQGAPTSIWELIG